MDAYDEGSDARHGPDGPGSPLRDGPVPTGAVPDDAPPAVAPEPSGGEAAVDPSRAEAPQADPSDAHPSRAETPHADPPQTDPPHAETPHADPSPADPSETSHADPPHAASPRGMPEPSPATREPFPQPASTRAHGEPFSPPESGPAPAPVVGIAALSLRHQIVAAFALAVVAVLACVHLGMVFLHVAPSNTVTKQHGKAIDEWVYPEFEQNWKLFAPNPLQQNIDVQVRARVRGTDGSATETGWYDLSALDGAAIDGNLLPSHTQQNELRRAWDFYVGTHDNDNRPVGLRGDLSERYLRRVVLLRLAREEAGGKGALVERVQVRSRTTNVPPPDWSDEQVSDRPVLRELPWWTVAEKDLSDTRSTEASAR
ncbi:DUF5819 family protein [Streptomyces sp. NPDC001185]|uniref:DUF5819 family protein n=1 Tax=Streptomyces sp. NPDC001185 TaxID=3154380 RepID=UPI0033273AE7